VIAIEGPLYAWVGMIVQHCPLATLSPNTCKMVLDSCDINHAGAIRGEHWGADFPAVSNNLYAAMGGKRRGLFQGRTHAGRPGVPASGLKPINAGFARRAETPMGCPGSRFWSPTAGRPWISARI